MHHATIDCPRRKVTFQKPGTKPFSLQFRQVGDRIPTISALQAQHLIESGCTAYLVSAMQTKSEVKNVSSIPVVSEFPDVFPTRITARLSEREVYFCIETKQSLSIIASFNPNPSLSFTEPLSSFSRWSRPYQGLLSDEVMHQLLTL